MSEEDHVNTLNDNIKPLWKILKEKLEGYPDTSFFGKKLYILENSKTVCFIHFRNIEFRIDISRGKIM